PHQQPDVSIDSQLETRRPAQNSRIRRMLPGRQAGLARRQWRGRHHLYVYGHPRARVMMTAVTIDDQELHYELQPAIGVYDFQVAGGTYRFRQWSWGEKNRVVEASTTVDDRTGHLRIDIATFNELMLATCLVRGDALSSVTPESLRDLNPV